MDVTGAMVTEAAALPLERGAAVAAPPRLRECPDCGLLQRLPPLPAHASAHCPRCDAVLRRRREDPVGRPLALCAAGLVLMVVAANGSFLDLDVRGIRRATTLATGPETLGGLGEIWVPLAVVVGLTTLVMPTLRLLGLGVVLLGLGRPSPQFYLSAVFRWVERLRPWSMVEVFLLGVFVAYTKLIDLARVDVGPAVFALGGLMLVMACADAALDPEAIWHRLDRRRGRGSPRGESYPELRALTLACDVCGEVNAAGARACVRCGSGLQDRKAHVFSRTWALLLAALILYIPANVFPVLTLIRLGQGQPSTIIGGARELAAAGMWPLAILVFVASITVPVLKLVGLSTLLVTTQCRSAWRLRERTRLYRIIDFIGRWSMIDVFMISILTALVRMGRVASVYPGVGVLAFCSVVVLTMVAAAMFDPRLMWDAAGQNAGRAAGAPR